MRIFITPNITEATPILHRPGDCLFLVKVRLSPNLRCFPQKSFILMAMDEKDAIHRVDVTCEEGIKKVEAGKATPETKIATSRVLTEIMHGIARGWATAEPLSHAEIYPVSYFDDERIGQ